MPGVLVNSWHFWPLKYRLVVYHYTIKTTAYTLTHIFFLILHKYCKIIPLFNKNVYKYYFEQILQNRGEQICC